MSEDVQTAPLRGIRKMRSRNKLLLILASLLMMGFLRTGFMFILIGLLPSIVTSYMDVTKHRYIFKTVFSCNLAGMTPFIGKMMHHGPTSSVLNEIMSTGSNWGIIYGSACVGWILVKVGPWIAHSFVLGMHQAQMARIIRLQSQIETEWGKEVAQFSQTQEEMDQRV